MKKYVALVLATAVAFGICGCMGKSNGAGDGQKLTRPVPKPPEYPKAHPQAVDQALRQRAGNQLRASVNSQNAFCRAHAVEASRYLPIDTTREIILKATSDPATVVRFAALMTAGEIRLPQVANIATKLLNDPDKSVQAAAIFALHRIGDVRYSHQLEEFASDPDRQVRANTALLLGLLGEKSAEKILRYQLHDNDPTIRLQASESLYRLGFDDALESLVIGTISRYPDDQMISATALASRHDPRVAEHLRGMLTSAYPEVSLVAARAMGMIRSDEGYGVATKGVASEDPRQRQLAAMAFGAIGRIDAQQMLGKLLLDTDEDVRIAAASSLLQLH